MRFQKLLGTTLIGFLLVGASGGAIAQDNCRDGLVAGYIKTDVIVRNRNCLIVTAAIDGDVVVKGAGNFTIIDSKVRGNIVAKESGVVTIMMNSATNINAIGNDTAVVVANTPNGNMNVNDTVQQAVVKHNIVTRNLTCQNNGMLDAQGNGTVVGEDNCP